MYNSPALPSAAPDRLPEVHEEMGRLAKQCEVIEGQLKSLEDRLQPILALRKEEGQTANSAPEPMRVPLAETLHQQVAHLSQLSDMLASIVNRIEV